MDGRREWNSFNDAKRDMCKEKKINRVEPEQVN